MHLVYLLACLLVLTRCGLIWRVSFKIGRPRIGLVHTCIMVNENMVLFRLSLDESGTDSRVTSISFSIEDSLNRSTRLDDFQQQQIMFPGKFAHEIALSKYFACMLPSSTYTRNLDLATAFVWY